MKFRHLSFPFLLLLAMAFVPGCSDAPPESQTTEEAPSVAPAPEAAPAAAEKPDKQAPETATTPDVASAKPAEHPASKKNSVPTITSNPQGKSTGYISRDNVALQKEPSANASKTRSFKRNEGVIILETKMTDETGKASDIPVWYKVECADQQVGWVVARSVTMN
ncbi:MAG: SH3 domain-containing protein [Bacteroidetes bacterium]|nr:SH3 domain-containing protein [Bacteroidota bacterium]